MRLNRSSTVFTLSMVRLFPWLMSDSAFISDPRHLHFFHKSFSSTILNPFLFDTFSVRFPFFSRSWNVQVRFNARFIFISSVLIKLTSSAYFGSLTTWCLLLSANQDATRKLCFWNLPLLVSQVLHPRIEPQSCSFVIYWNLLMVEQIFLSPQV